MDILKQISEELSLKSFQVENTVELLNTGNTVPFISRYRKEKTGNLDEEQIRRVEELLKYYTNLENYKITVLKSIEEQGKLTDSLKEKINSTKKMSTLEDIYLPYKKRKKTNADKAIEAGLEFPTTKILLGSLNSKDDLKEFCVEKYETVEKVIEGISYILGQNFSHDNENRQLLRNYYENYGFIYSYKKKEFKEENTKFDMYDEFKQEIKKIQNYRVLAINRGEKDNVLTVKIELDEKYLKMLKSKYYTKNEICNEIIDQGLDYGFKNMLNPSIEREIRSSLTEKAEIEAIKLFSNNLKQLLLTPPLKNKRVLAIDPAYRTGCKTVALDESGKYLEFNAIYPVPPHNDVEKSEKEVLKMIEKYKLNLIVIGNGTASRETQQFIVEVIKKNKLNLKYMFANEAGASVYSASKLAKDEFPDFDVTVRGAISIGRRIQDPLAELVKIDPKSIGVGQYQHDINQKNLKENLNNTVESVVNSVGVNLNTSSAALLDYVSGMTSKVSKKIVQHREKNGKFSSRNDLFNIKGFGEKTFEQCAGFLRIFEGENPLEITGIHPESYKETEKLLESLGFKKEDILDKDKFNKLRQKINEIINDKEKILKTSENLEIGEYTLTDILKELQKPGRDPREDMPQPILMEDILTFDDLKEGLRLTGKVTNITDFGAFVDLGIKENGLLHKSNLSDKFIKHPSEILEINDIVEVEIINIEKNLKRIGLKLIKK